MKDDEVYDFLDEQVKSGTYSIYELSKMLVKKFPNLTMVKAEDIVLHYLGFLR